MVTSRFIHTTMLQNGRYSVDIVSKGSPTMHVTDVILAVEYEDGERNSISLPPKDISTFYEIVEALKEQVQR